MEKVERRVGSCPRRTASTWAGATHTHTLVASITVALARTVPDYHQLVREGSDLTRLSMSGRRLERRSLCTIAAVGRRIQRRSEVSGTGLDRVICPAWRENSDPTRSIMERAMHRYASQEHQ